MKVPRDISAAQLTGVPDAIAELTLVSMSYA